MSPEQTGNLLTVFTPLGQDKFLLESFRGHEEMSALFEFELQLLSSETEIDPAELVGKSVAFQVTPDSGPVRPFSGFVSSLAYGGLDRSGRRRFRATLVPWFWFLTKRSSCRVFQEMTVKEIVERVFADAGFSDYDISGISSHYPAYEYCVQFRESDFDFVSRLLEEEGIFYYFRFEDEKHTLCLADSKAAYEPCIQGEVQYTDTVPSSEQVHRWEHQYGFVSGKWTHTDFNFTTPQTSLLADSPTVVPLPGLDAFERYEYPGRYQDRSHGESKVRARMEAEESGYDVVHGAGGCPAFQLAQTFTLTDHPFADEDSRSYVLTAITHAGTEGALYQSSSPETGYSNSFRCVPDDVPFRPQRTIPRPVVPGPQTAVVVGASGEEIYTDEYGRVKVQFHWDREGNYDEKSSCWMRVAQSTAGKRWGAQVLPRVGQEVVVEFLDGDPDRPLVVGAVFNADTMPLYPLPDCKTQSGYRSMSSKGAANDAFNELRFEDEKGFEHIFIHAQKDEHHRVVNDRYDHVGNDEHRVVVKNRLEKIDGDTHHVTAGDRFEQVKGSTNSTVEEDRKVSVQSEDHLSVERDQLICVDGEQGITVKGKHQIKVGSDSHRDAGGDVHDLARENFAIEGRSAVHIKGGMDVVIEAGGTLTLKAGQSFVVLGASGVDISGTAVKINSGGSAGSGSGCSPQGPGSPSSPDAPEPAEEPMEKSSAATSKKYKAQESKNEAYEAKWTAIETSPSTPQAQALQSASKTGQPFCDT